ncbi:MAG: hypothetical protein JWP12_75 [Bacteroidetes bacterium]|nr:hypothetical protein [Bacteroidota bacterium]
MQSSFNTFPEILFFVVFVIAIATLLYAFGWQIVKDVRKGKRRVDSSVTPKQVTHYFIDKGYVVCNITPVKNSNKWLAFLIKNGEYLIATVFTNGQTIEGHLDSLE